MAQWARTVSSRTSGIGIQDSAKTRVSEVTLPSISRAALIRPNAFSPGNSWCPASHLAETTVPVRVSFRP